MPVQSIGPTAAKVFIVGEVPSEQDLLRGQPFCGTSGLEMSKLLAEAGIHRETCYMTLVCKDRVPFGKVTNVVATKKKDITHKHLLWNGKYVTQQVYDGAMELKREIELVKPNVVCAVGNLALFALTGQWGVNDWRSSVMESTLIPGLKVIPIRSPDILFGQWNQRPILLHDLKRVARQSQSPIVSRPDYSHVIRPSYEKAMQVLSDLHIMADAALAAGDVLDLGTDIETRAGHIACIAFAWTEKDAICIPLMCQHNTAGYWTEEEEANLVFAMCNLMRKVRVIGQNWNYDAQYIYRHWHFICPLVEDTMVQHHSCFSAMAKNLAFLSSMYLEDHLYWKDDRTNWTEGPKGEGEDQYWVYNCTDSCRTLAINKVLRSVIKQMGMTEVNNFQQALLPAVLRSMNKGVRVDNAERARFSVTLQDEALKRTEWMAYVLEHEVNIKSPKQMCELFYQELGQKEIRAKRADGGLSPTTNDEALKRIGTREPLLLPLTRKISELRSLGVFHSTFVQAPLDVDGRIRTSFNICGTETYRFSSSKNAFGTGLNCQNIPNGGETEDAGLELPNVRKIFIPDPGHTCFDIDLDSADLRIVTWESDCKWMKEQFKNKKKPYIEVMKEYYRNPDMTKDSHPREYGMFKALCHGCLTAGHEVLTPSGWVPIESYDPSIPLMQWELETSKSYFEVPKGFTHQQANYLVHLEGESYSSTVTHDHRVPFTTDTKHRVTSAVNLPGSSRLPMCGYLDGAEQVLPVVAQLLAAFQADGSLDSYDNVTFNLRRERKIARLDELLRQAGINFTSTDSDLGTRFYIPHAQAKVFSQYGKQAGPYLMQWSAEALDAFLNDLQYWDGSSAGTIKCHVTTVHKDHADWIQTIAKLRGLGSQVNVQREAEGNRQTLYRVSLNNRKYFNLNSGTKWEEKLHDKTVDVYCPLTRTGFFFVRRNGKVYVTGNTNYLGTADGIAPRIGLNVLETERIQKWYYGMCPEIKVWQDNIKKQVTKRRFVENVFGYRMYFFDKIEGTIFNQAVAWIPQSTVACLINRAYVKIDANLPETEILLQVHDSLMGQFQTHHGDWAMRRIIEQSQVALPYAEPLIIPVGIKTSTKSWGDCA